MKKRIGFLLFAIWLSAAGVFAADTNVVLRVRGDVSTPLDLTITDLEALPRHTENARDHEGAEAKYEGVPLHEILRKGGVSMREDLRGPALRSGFLVKARDGYAALFSVAEVDPDMTDRVVFLADLKDNEPLPSGQGPLRVIVTGEKRHARWVREVTEIEVVRVSPRASAGIPPRNEELSGPVVGSVLIAAAADLVFALDELNGRFTNAYPQASVKVSTGASGNFFAQIRQGAPFEVFLSADISFPERLAAEGKADLSTLFPYAQGHLVLWTTRTNITVANGLDELLRTEAGKVAVANPDTAPYGRAAKAALTKAGLWDRLQPKMVIGENIAQTAQFIERGAANAGIVALSLVTSPRLSKTGTWWAVPENLHPPIVQGAILTNPGTTNTVAKAYLQFLRTPEAREVFKRFGLGIPARD